jgi:hypothetical protein
MTAVLDEKSIVARGAEFRAALAGRRVTVVGLARSGVAACRLLRACGARVTATDAKPAALLGETARALAAEGVRLHAGGHPPEAFADAELCVTSPGVPAEHPALADCRRRGVPVIGEVELAYRAMTADVLAVTGTNGKTTTTALLGALAAESGRPILVGGNIGRPLAAEALTVPADGLVVAEVSSFQLETTDTFRPRVAALLNVTPDHLDRHASVAAYAEAKARIFANQTAADWAVLNADDPGPARGRPARGAASCGSAGPGGWTKGATWPAAGSPCASTDRTRRSVRSARSPCAATTTWRTCSPRRRPRPGPGWRPSGCAPPSGRSGPSRTGWSGYASSGGWPSTTTPRARTWTPR